MGQVPEVDAESSRKGSMNKRQRKEKIMENTCKTCINNDDGLCDRKAILVEDEDSCEKHREDWREAMLRQFNRRR